VVRGDWRTLVHGPWSMESVSIPVENAGVLGNYPVIWFIHIFVKKLWKLTYAKETGFRSGIPIFLLCLGKMVYPDRECT